MPSPKFESTPTSNTINHFESLPCKRTKSSSSETVYIDLPPDSFWVSKGDENDSFDRNEITQRKSTRRLSFSGCPTHHFHQETLIPRRSSISKTPPFIIGLPVGNKKHAFPGAHHWKRKAAGSVAHFVKTRSEPAGKLEMQATEPASPQVNCLGRVGTKKEKVKKTGVWENIAAVLKTGFKSSSIASPVSSSSSSNAELNNKERTVPVRERFPVEKRTQQPNLAGLMRLTSGRRASGITELKDE